jgi:hypothetical protein
MSLWLVELGFTLLDARAQRRELALGCDRPVPLGEGLCGNRRPEGGISERG